MRSFSVNGAARRGFGSWVAAAGALALAAACGGDPEVVSNDDDLDGGAGSGGTSGSGTGGSGGNINVDGGGTGGTAASDGGGDPCGTAQCTPGQRCEEVDGGATCVNNECSDLMCSATERCEPHPDGGNVCADISCTSDTECDESEFCDGTKCVDDVCDPGARECVGQELRECASNGGASEPRFTCGSTAYFNTQCTDDGMGEADCTCEDDWDCPADTVCEVGKCVGTGVTPSCTLDPVPFASVPPAVEIFWGGESQANSAAKDGTPQQNPAPWAPYAHVLGTPVVANLDDDNGDGLINELDFPEIIFTAHQGDNPWDNGVVRAIHGGGVNKGADYFARCGNKLWTSANPSSDTCTGGDPDGDSGAPVAVGDLDYDGVPEIVHAVEDNTFRILDNTGAEIYKLATAWSPGRVGRTVSIANLDYAGYAEIIVGRNVYVLGDDSGGNLIVTHILSGTEAEGNNGSFGTMSCPADIAPAAGQEIVVGATAYRLPDNLPTCGSPPCTGALEIVWNGPDRGDWPGNLTGNGFCAVADVWGSNFGATPGPSNAPDGKPEVILIDDGRLAILAGDTGEVIENRSLQGGSDGGAPNVDDFDGDGFPEIASALQDFYVVVDLQPSTGSGGTCPEWPSVIPRAQGAANPNTPRGGGAPCMQTSDCGDPELVCNTVAKTCVCLHNGWRRDSDDDSSRATSSSVFDFNGDGAAEVIYNDECEFRVYDGVSGLVYFGEVSRSRTGIENTVVADVDNDGNAEVVSVMNTAVNNRCDDDPGNPRIPQGPNGIRVWGDPTDTWVSARRIWNQQSYHVTNITESGQVPLHAPESWGSYNGRIYNTYRSQPRNFGVAPDLTVSDVSVFSPDAMCGVLSDNIDIVFEIENLGDLRVGPGIEVTFFGTWAGVEEQLLDGSGNPLTVTLQNSLEPGNSVILSVNFNQANNGKSSLPDSVRVVVDGNDAERECEEMNNSAEETVSPGTQRPDLRLEVDTATQKCPDAEVEFTLFNDGTAPVSNVVVRFYAGDPSAGGTQLAEVTIAGPIAVGSSVTQTVNITSLPQNRTILIYGVADPENAIEECNEANNKDAADNTVRCGVVQ